MPFFGFLVAATVAVQSFAVGGITQNRFDYAVAAGALFGMWGGAAAALMPWGENTWGWKRALRVVGLAIVAGTLCALWLYDTNVAIGKRSAYEVASGFLGEQLFLLLRFTGKERLAQFLRERREPEAPTPPPSPAPSDKGVGG